MLKRKTVCKSLLLMLVVCLLSGCWDRKELEDKAYVIGLGLDRSKDEGKIKVTMLIANPEVGSMQGGGGSQEKAKEIITFDANDFITAKGTANGIISRKISYELLRIFVVSEEFAKEPDSLKILYDTLKDKDIRMDSYLAVSKEKAYKYFLRNKPRMETRPHKYFQFMIDHGIENGLIPDSTLFRFFKTVEGGNDLFLAMYTTTERQKTPKIKGEDEYLAGQLNVTGDLDDTQFLGSAVFKNGIMIDKLSGQYTRIVNTLDDTTNIDDILINTPDFFSNEKDQMAFRLLKTARNKVKINVREPKLKIEITIPFSVEVLANPSMVNFKNDKNKRKLKQNLTNHLTKVIEDVLIKAQTDLKGAPYPLSLYARKHFWTVKEYEDFNWSQAFVDADITTKVEIDIVDYGKTSTKIKKMED
jgi:Ger(x)C family germination protein